MVMTVTTDAGDTETGRGVPGVRGPRGQEVRGVSLRHLLQPGLPEGGLGQTQRQLRPRYDH